MTQENMVLGIIGMMLSGLTASGGERSLGQSGNLNQENGVHQAARRMALEGKDSLREQLHRAS